MNDLNTSLTQLISSKQLTILKQQLGGYSLRPNHSGYAYRNFAWYGTLTKAEDKTNTIPFKDFIGDDVL